MDLIAFDSPFVQEPEPTINQDTAFETMWNALDQSSGARGWCNDSIDKIVQRLQGLEHHLQVISADQPPFEGTCFSTWLFTALYPLLMNFQQVI
jgi:AP-4 complex subunit epsilon-1